MKNIFEQFFQEDDIYIPLYKDKQYLHFDMEFASDYIKNVMSRVRNNGKLEHGFYPLICYKIPKYKYCKDSDGKFYIDKTKTRPIMHTARTDAMIYAFYRAELMNYYEKLLFDSRISVHVIAYRKIENPNSNSNKCNVHFANEAIDEIIKRKNCCAIAMDITGFFDNLDHKIIKKQWLKVINKTALPEDHYMIYKNITKYRYIDAEELEKILSINFKEIHKSNKKILSKKIRLLDNLELREKIIPELKKKNMIGIPQGTTISDAIANIYMIDFDKELSDISKENNWYYRRYSDDILIICELGQDQKVIDIVKKLIKNECKLEINDKKTLISNFEYKSDMQECITYKYDEDIKPYIQVSKPFEYLGLSFDGQKKRIRTSTLSKFYQKLSGRISKEVKIAKRKLATNEIKKPTAQQLYKKIQFIRIYDDYLGKYSSTTYKKEKESCVNKIDEANLHEDWRNFYSYAELVAKVTDDEAILNIFDGTVKWIRKKAKEQCYKKCK